MTRVIKAMLLSMLLALGLHANDLLSKATDGILSDSSMGVKHLSNVEMQKILGGYKFARASEFDFYSTNPNLTSYGFAVLDDKNEDAGVVADEFNLGANELLVVKVRFNSMERRYTSYVNVYNLSGQKVRDFTHSRSHDIIRDFENKVLSRL
ncbi:MAG: hypothetical protein K5978_01165 [Campylobacter sp.]|nr:hypothetical protein [Campylobacter sp.]